MLPGSTPCSSNHRQASIPVLPERSQETSRSESRVAHSPEVPQGGSSTLFRLVRSRQGQPSLSTPPSRFYILLEYQAGALHPIDLLTGATVRDVTDTIPGDLFDDLFKSDPQ
jgi:hypothetical protein